MHRLQVANGVFLGAKGLKIPGKTGDFVGGYNNNLINIYYNNSNINNSLSMKTNNISFNLLYSCLEKAGFEVHLYYDRLKMYFDSASNKTDIENIYHGVHEKKVISRALPHYDTMHLMLDAYRPNANYLQKLDSVVTGNHLINYIEFAMDIISDSKSEVSKLRKFFNDSLIVDRKRSSPRFYHKEKKKTHYYGYRNRHKDMLVIYSAKKYRFDKSKYCVHIERRLYGSKDIKKLGIYTIQDLLNYNHESIWDRHLDLRDANYNSLGQAYSDENLVASTYWRNGKKVFERYPSAQAFLKENPNYIESFIPITDRRMLESRISRAMK